MSLTAGHIVKLFDEVKGVDRLASPILWSVTQVNPVNRARVLIGLQLPTYACQPHVRYENVDEKVGENRGKFYLSPPVCQRVRRLFLCRSHTQTWVC